MKNYWVDLNNIESSCWQLFIFSQGRNLQLKDIKVNSFNPLNIEFEHSGYVADEVFDLIDGKFNKSTVIIMHKDVMCSLYGANIVVNRVDVNSCDSIKIEMTIRFEEAKLSSRFSTDTVFTVLNITPPFLQE